MVQIGSINEPSWKQATLDIHTILTTYNIKYWLDEGSLIGALRHQGFVPWDNDVDFSITNSQKQKLINAFPDIRKLGFTIRYQKKKNHISFHKQDIKIDINIYTENLKQIRWWNEEHIIARGLDFIMRKTNQNPLIETLLFPIYTKFCEKIETIIIPPTYLSTTKTIKLFDTDFIIPNHPEAYLTFRFGDWETPRHKGKLVKEWKGEKI